LSSLARLSWDGARDRRYLHEVLAALSLDFDDRRSSADVEAAVSRIEREIKAAFPEATRVFSRPRTATPPSQTETPV
jgi:hypothetical protein